MAMYKLIALLLDFHIADGLPFPAPTQALGIVKSAAVQPLATTPNLRKPSPPPKCSIGDEICGNINGLSGKAKMLLSSGIVRASARIVNAKGG